MALETHDSVPRNDVGFLVQECVKSGAWIVVVTQNPDKRACTVSPQQG